MTNTPLGRVIFFLRNVIKTFLLIFAFNAKYPSINEDTCIIGHRFAVFQKEMRIKLEIESFRLSVTQFSVISTEYIN